MRDIFVLGEAIKADIAWRIPHQGCHGVRHRQCAGMQLTCKDNGMTLDATAQPPLQGGDGGGWQGLQALLHHLESPHWDGLLLPQQLRHQRQQLLRNQVCQGVCQGVLACTCGPTANCPSDPPSLKDIQPMGCPVDVRHSLSLASTSAYTTEDKAHMVKPGDSESGTRHTCLAEVCKGQVYLKTTSILSAMPERDLNRWPARRGSSTICAEIEEQCQQIAHDLQAAEARVCIRYRPGHSRQQGRQQALQQHPAHHHSS